jgi:TolB-like protein/rhodanese-related sulfurtransferase/Flp pilus assembly protein TadD
VGYRLVAEVSGSPAENSVTAFEASLSGRARTSAQRPLWVGAAVLVGIVIGVALIWVGVRHWQDEPAISQPTADLTGGKPSIAVLPFTNLSGDPEQGYFADGMTDDLITRLSKLSGLLVIARSSTFKYKGQSPDISQVSRELGVRYVLEGSVRRAGERVRINAQLIDAKTGGHLWADLYDTSLTDIFAVQDKVTQNVVDALSIHLTTGEKERQRLRKTDNPEAYEAVLRAQAHFEFGSQDDFAKAISYLEKAVQLDPDYARAHGLLASVYYEAWEAGFTASLGLSVDEARDKLEKYLEKAMKDPSPEAFYTSTNMLTNQFRNDEAMSKTQQWLASNPNDFIGYKALARIANKSGRPAEGLAAGRMALRLNPRGDDQGGLSYRIGESLFHLERYDAAAGYFEVTTERSPDDEWSRLYLAAIYGHLGRKQDGKSLMEVTEQLLAKKGRRPFTLASINGWAFKDPADGERFREGLRQAGVPQGGASPPAKYMGVVDAATEVRGATTVNTTWAKALSDRGVPFVDVRRDFDWKAGHVPGAQQLHLYHDFTEAKLSDVVAKNEEFVVYGGGLGSGWSTRAVATAVSMGFTKVYFFREGFPGWKAAGYPIEVASK